MKSLFILACVFLNYGLNGQVTAFLAFQRGLHRQSNNQIYINGCMDVTAKILNPWASYNRLESKIYLADDTIQTKLLLDEAIQIEAKLVDSIEYDGHYANNTTNPWIPQSVLLLNIVAILWGTQHAVIKLVVEDTEVSAWSLTRFGLAAILAAPFTPIFSNRSNITTTWRWGAEMGLWMFLGYAFQAVGLEYTTAQRSGFLLYLNVKFVPFLARILLGRSISVPTWISAFTAFVGTALLSFDGKTPSLNVGDVWSIAAAMASAMFILRLERASIMVTDSAALNSATLWIVTLLSLIWCTLQSVLHSNFDFSGSINTMSLTIPDSSNFIEVIRPIAESVMTTIQKHPWELIYLGGVTTALSNYIQTKAQRGISAERAAVIYAMDPVYGAVFSYWILGEQLNLYGLVGAVLITLAAALNTSLDLGKTSTKEGSQL